MERGNARGLRDRAAERRITGEGSNFRDEAARLARHENHSGGG